MNRREFLGSSTVAAAGLASSAVWADEAKKVSPNEKVVVALIGCGGMGNANLGGFIRLPDFEVVALCDPDTDRLGSSMNLLKERNRPTEGHVKTYADYRKMIDERKDLDAVIIGTPDHHHAYALTYACIAGKGGTGLDVYCEKPLSHNVVEGRAMVNATRKQNRIVQIGTQQRSGRHFKDAIAYVHSGKLGHVYLCRTWITNNDDRDYGAPEEEFPPANLDYDLWLGPAPYRPYTQYHVHHNFRWFYDYGSGLCNDWGVHLNDIILWGMKVQAPIAVSAVGGRYDVKDVSDTPDTLDVVYEYPDFTHIYTVRRGKTHALKSGHGMEFQGVNGTLYVDRGGWRVTPAEGNSLPAERHGGSEQHFTHVKNFLHCMRNRSEKTASDIEDMHRATTTAHLANISYKVKRRIFWDAENERCYRGYNPATKQFVHEDSDANALLFREPRKGWKLALS